MDIKGLIPAILIAITFIFSIAACGAQQFHRGNSRLYLVKATAGNGWSQNNEDYGCKEMRESMNAAAAFGIMACILAGVATIIAILAFIGKFPGPKIVNVILLVVVAVFSLISWAVVIHVFEDDMCKANYKDANYELAGGFACMIITTALALISLILSMVLGGGGDGVKPV